MLKLLRQQRSLFSQPRFVAFNPLPAKPAPSTQTQPKSNVSSTSAAHVDSQRYRQWLAQVSFVPSSRARYQPETTVLQTIASPADVTHVSSHDENPDEIAKAKFNKIDKVSGVLPLGKLVKAPYFTGYPTKVSDIDLYGNGKWVTEYENGYATYTPTHRNRRGKLTLTLSGDQYSHIGLPNHFRSVSLPEQLIDWCLSQTGSLQIIGCRPQNPFGDCQNYENLIYCIHSCDEKAPRTQHLITGNGTPISSSGENF